LAVQIPPREDRRRGGRAPILAWALASAAAATALVGCSAGKAINDDEGTPSTAVTGRPDQVQATVVRVIGR